MNNPILIITLVTLFVILGSVYLEMRRQTKPRIKVCFPGGSTQMSYQVKEEANVAIHIQNRGRLGFPKPVARNVHAFIYTPTNFLLKELRWSGESETRVQKAASGGIFGGMNYLTTPVDLIINLFHGEEETTTVHMQMPEETGVYPIKVAVLSSEGDLGVHELKIIVS